MLATVFILSLLPSCKSHKSLKPETGQRVETIQVSPSSKTQSSVVEEAYSWIGTPYRYAKAEKGVGTDCSGMVMMVYETATGRKIPRNSAKQAEFCEKVSEGKVKAGDLVFFATGKDPERVSHVGIVVDSEQFIHASSSKGVVVSLLTSPYYRKHFLMFGKVP